MSLTAGKINDRTLGALTPPPRPYYLALAALAAVIGWFLLSWLYQILAGMGVAGINHPVGWGVYIASFVFWVGIAHSGTLISAILHLTRANWRDSVARASEAMTLIAILTAGMFPLIHLGRVWVFYYLVPYPTTRQIYPNFTSPLVMDLLAVFTYLTVSTIFFTIGLIPDAAAARDRDQQRLGKDHWRTKFYGFLAAGWSGTGNQWRHYDRSYLFFAALATPLVISVHSIVSWDFAVGIVPGWHTTIYAPYFVAGAIHSGLAMVIVLMIPMRRMLGVQSLITDRDLGMVAATIVVTAAIMGYSYLIEPGIGWYSGHRVERQFVAWRATGWSSWMYWSLVPLNVLLPLSFIWKKARETKWWLIVVSVGVLIGMYLERIMLTINSTARDFLPHNWGSYVPSWVELSILAGAAAFFFFFFLVFTKTLPVVTLYDLKESVVEEKVPDVGAPRAAAEARPSGGSTLVATFGDPGPMLRALKVLREDGFQDLETYSPVKLLQVNRILGRKPSPIRVVTLLGALTGLVCGYWLAAGTASINNLVVGGKPVLSWIPFTIPAFEGAVLIGSLANLAALIFFARLITTKPDSGYRPEFSRDKYGIRVRTDGDNVARARERLQAYHPEEVKDGR